MPTNDQAGGPAGSTVPGRPAVTTVRSGTVPGLGTVPGRPGDTTVAGAPAPSPAHAQAVPEQATPEKATTDQTTTDQAATDQAATEQPAIVEQLQGVDDALASLADLPLDAQVAVFTDLHQRLTAALDVAATAAQPVDDPPRYRPGQPSHRSR